MLNPLAVRTVFLQGVMVILSLTILACLVRAILGPRFTDRLVAVNMINTQVTLFIAVLSVCLDERGLADISLLYAMLSFLAVVIFTKIDIALWQDKGRKGAA